MYRLAQQKKIYYCFNFVNRFMVYMPVFVLFFKMKGLNQTQVMVIMSAYNIAIMLGEIPTGVVADKISRKKSVIIGCFIQGISMLFMIPFSNFLALICIELIFGIGLTFQSGAMSAMFYDYLKSIGKEDLYPDIEGKRWACVFVSQALASIAGGILASYNIVLTILITGIAYILSAVVLMGFKEVKVPSEKEFKYMKHISSTFKYIISVKNVVVMFVVIVFTQTLFSTTMWLYQPYYQNIGIKVSAYGIAYFLMNGVSAFGGFLSGKMNISYKKVIILYMAGNALFVGMMGIIHSAVGVIIPSFIFFINGLLTPWIQSFWEKNIESSKRATASSLLSVISSILFTIVAIPIGYLSDSISIYAAFGISSIVFVVIIIFLYFCSKYIKEEKEYGI